MKNIWKNISTCLLVAFVGIGATYGTYSYMDYKRDYSPAGTYNYEQGLDQGPFRPISLISGGEYPDFTAVVESSLHGVVHVKTTVKSFADANQGQRRRMPDPFEFFFGDPGQKHRMPGPFEFFFGEPDGDNYRFENPQPRVGFGSGVLISEDGYIITNNHVIEKAADIEVTLDDNRKFTAKLLGTDPQTDIALLKIEGKGFPYIPFGNSDKLKVGEWVLAIGNPFNLTSTVTAGIVSAKGRTGMGGMTGPDGVSLSIQSFIQTDAAINSGNSGGALVNIKGELVGINTMIYSHTGNFAGYGFAIPVSIAGKVIADIKEYGAVQRAVLGIQIQDLHIAKELNPDKTKDIKLNEGVYVADFAEISPAKQAGIQQGDVIVAINGVKVRTSGELQDQVNRFRPGDKVKVDIMRDTTSRSYTVTLKNSSGNTSPVKKKDGIATVGAAFRDIPENRKKSLGISYGVEVAGVDNTGKFHKEGIMKGFIIRKINNQPVSSASQVENLIASTANSPDKVLFIAGITPAGAKKYYAVDLGE